MKNLELIRKVIFLFILFSLTGIVTVGAITNIPILFTKVDLFKAVEASDLIQIKTIIESDQFGIDEVNKNGNSALLLAVKKDADIEVLHYLLEQGANLHLVNLKLEKKLTVFDLSLEKPIDILRTLLLQKINPLTLIDVIRRAVRKDKFHHLKLILRSFKGRDLYIRALNAALSEASSPQLSKYLIEQGAEREYFDLESSLRKSAYKGTLSDIKFWIAEGATFIPKNDPYEAQPRSIIGIVTRNLHGSEIIKYLAKYGSSILPKEWKKEALLYALTRSGRFDSIKTLVEIGAPLSLISLEHIVRYAIEHKEYRTLQYLVDRGLSPSDQRIYWGIYVALGGDDLEALDILLAAGFDINVSANDGRGTPLLAAIGREYGKGDSGKVEYLLNHGADVNQLARDGKSPLHEAVQNSTFQVVKLLIDQGANLKHLYNGQTVLDSLIQNLSPTPKNFIGNAVPEKLAMVEYLLSLGLKSNLMSGEVLTAFISEGATVDDLRKLQKKGIQFSGDGFRKALIWVLKKDAELGIPRYGSIDIIKFLMAQLSRPINALYLFQQASLAENMLFMKYIINHLDIPTKEKLTNLLIQAAGNGRANTVKYLLRMGADVNGKNKYNGTPIAEASAYLRLEVIRILVAHGADINLDFKSRGPLLNIVIERRHGKSDHAFKIIKYLVSQGINVDLASAERGLLTPLMVASISGDLSITKYFYKQGANLNLENTAKKTALDFAIRYKKIPTVVFLLNHGAKIGKGTLAYALEYRMGPKIVNKILEEGTELDAATSDRKRTPLMEAAYDTELVRYLVSRGANVNKSDYKGWTPLMFAATSGNIRSMKFLVEKGAKLDSSLKKDEVDNFCKWIPTLESKSLILSLDRSIIAPLLDHGGCPQVPI